VKVQARLARLELAFKTRQTTHFPVACLCFPADEQPEFKWKAEAAEAATVLCPLHGRRFQMVVTRFLYRATRFYVADFKYGWPNRSAQYQKAMRASLNPELWPAEEVPLPWPQETQELILRDGTRIPSGGSAVEGYQMDSRVKKHSV
jgi:hypothetical protein